MKRTIFLVTLAACLLLASSCNQPAQTENEKTSVETPTSTAEDPAQVKADIVATERAWAEAMNKKDLDALMAMYAEDAISMLPNEPMLMGKEAIRKAQEAEFAKPAKYDSIAFETLDVYGTDKVITEIGKAMYMNNAGETKGTGKYIAVFEKRDGKYLCIREMYSSDSK